MSSPTVATVASATFAITTALDKAKQAEVAGHAGVAMLEAMLEQAKEAEEKLEKETPVVLTDGNSSAFEMGGNNDFSDWM